MMQPAMTVRGGGGDERTGDTGVLGSENGGGGSLTPGGTAARERCSEFSEPAPGFPTLEQHSVAILKDTAAVEWIMPICAATAAVQLCRLRLLDVRGCGSVTADGLLRLPADNLQHLFLSRSGATARCGALYPLLERWRHSLLELDLVGGGWTRRCGR